MPYIPCGETQLLLYRFVEIIDEQIDYDKIIAEYPGLSYSQISSVMSFFRKISQFNSRVVDVDDTIDEILFSDGSFIEQMRDSISNSSDNVFHIDE